MSSRTLIFWTIVVLAFLWHAMGIWNLINQQSPEYIANLPESMRAAVETRPLWATIGFGISVVAGTLAAILLALRNRLSSTLFWLAALGAIIAAIPLLGGAGSALMLTLLSALVAAALAIYAKRHVG